MKDCEVIELRLEDDPEKIFEFIRVFTKLETLYEISIFNEEMREIRKIENFFQLPFFKEEFNDYRSLDYDNFYYDYRGYNVDNAFYFSNYFYM